MVSDQVRHLKHRKQVEATANGGDISKDITDLGNCFVTSTGQDLSASCSK